MLSEILFHMEINQNSAKYIDKGIEYIKDRFIKEHEKLYNGMGYNSSAPYIIMVCHGNGNIAIPVRSFEFSDGMGLS